MKRMGMAELEHAARGRVEWHLPSPRKGHPRQRVWVSRRARAWQRISSAVTVAGRYAKETIGAADAPVFDDLVKPLGAMDVDSDISAQTGRLVRQCRRSPGNRDGADRRVPT